MFKLENNVPEIYVQESRDFQLFCRLYDSVFGGVKYSIDSLQQGTSTFECNDNLLDLLRIKLGLFKDLKIPNDELRIVLDTFPTIIKYKGSEQAIKYVLNMYQRLIKNNDATYIYNIINQSDAPSIYDEYTIYLRFSKEQKYDALLKELLKLILPTGYNLIYEIAELSNPSTSIEVEDNLEVYMVNQSNVLKYVGTDDLEEYPAQDLTSAVGLTPIGDPTVPEDMEEDNI